MAKLLFVVHRYAPFPGGSEYNTQRYAEAAVKLGHDVTVLAASHKGDYNGVKLTNDDGVIYNKWDMIIVHGDAPHAQNKVHRQKLPSPVMYLLINPHNDEAVHIGMQNATWIGCATLLDIGFVIHHQFKDKIKIIQYPIKPPSVELLTPKEVLVEKFGIDPHKNIVLSCGGFWTHKGFRNLANIFRSTNPQNLQLILTGYDWSGYDKFNESENVHQLYLEDINDVYSFMAIADQYIMNSEAEGFGLVLLEASYYGVPWLARPVGGASDLAEAGLGFVYSLEESLMTWIKTYDKTKVRTLSATPKELHTYVIENYDPIVVTKNLLSMLN